MVGTVFAWCKANANDRFDRSHSRANKTHNRTDSPSQGTMNPYRAADCNGRSQRRMERKATRHARRKSHRDNACVVVGATFFGVVIAAIYVFAALLPT